MKYIYFVIVVDLLRPVFLLQTYGSIISNRLIEGDYSKMNTWNHLIHGEHIYKLDPEKDIYDDTYYRDEFMDIKLKHPNYIDYLIQNQCMIEYVDPMESEGLFISKSIHSIDKNILIVKYILHWY